MNQQHRALRPSQDQLNAELVLYRYFSAQQALLYTNLPLYILPESGRSERSAQELKGPDIRWKS